VHVTDSRSSAADNVQVAGDQYRVADRVAARRDAAVLAAAPRPGRRPGQSRAEDAALPRPARRCPARPRRSPPPAANPRHLALGPRHHRGLAADHRPASGTL